MFYQTDVHDTVGYHSRCTVVLFLSQLLTQWAWPDGLYTLTTVIDEWYRLLGYAVYKNTTFGIV